MEKTTNLPLVDQLPRPAFAPTSEDATVLKYTVQHFIAHELLLEFEDDLEWLAGMLQNSVIRKVRAGLTAEALREQLARYTNGT